MAGLRNGLLVFLALIAGSTATAATIEANPQNYRALVRGLAAGDVLELRAGRYEQGLTIHDLHGAPGRPIVVRGPKEGEPALFPGRENRNTVSIVASSYVEIRNLVLDGRGLEVAGVRAERRDALVHHITIENLIIVGHGPEQQTVGISTAAPAAYWTIRNNVIVGAGTGLYLGGSDGAAPFVAGLIEGNVIVGTTGYNLQIKHQNPRPLLQGMPEGPSRTTLRGNVFAKTAASSTGNLARPNLLLGHFPLEGPGRDDEYRVEQNVFYGNPTEALMQAEGNLVIEGNLFLNPFGDGLAIQPHKDVPRRVAVVGNFVAASGAGLRLVGADPDYPQVVSRNELFAAHAVATIGPGNAIDAPDRTAAALGDWLARTAARTTDSARSPLLEALARACGPQQVRAPGYPPITVMLADNPACILLRRPQAVRRP